MRVLGRLILGAFALLVAVSAGALTLLVALFVDPGANAWLTGGALAGLDLALSDLSAGLPPEGFLLLAAGQEHPARAEHLARGAARPGAPGSAAAEAGWPVARATRIPERSRRMGRRPCLAGGGASGYGCAQSDRSRCSLCAPSPSTSASTASP